jgi:hypothetical protein
MRDTTRAKMRSRRAQLALLPLSLALVTQISMEWRMRALRRPLSAGAGRSSRLVPKERLSGRASQHSFRIQCIARFANFTRLRHRGRRTFRTLVLDEGILVEYYGESLGHFHQVQTQANKKRRFPYTTSWLDIFRLSPYHHGPWANLN